MGLNEASGYLAVSLSALCAGYFSAIYDAPMAMLGIGESVAVAGLCISAFFIHESRTHAEAEAREHGEATQSKSFKEIFLLTSWRDRTLFSVSFAGMVNNLNDGTAWGLFPLYFVSRGLSIEKIGVLVALYPAIWGLGELGTGALSDRIGRKMLIVEGMVLQRIAIILLTVFTGFAGWALASVLLGIGTAMVYPTFRAAIGDVAHSSWRAPAVGFIGYGATVVMRLEPFWVEFWPMPSELDRPLLRSAVSRYLRACLSRWSCARPWYSKTLP
jgi:hypothetical protein